jgi:hypothetical protein
VGGGVGERRSGRKEGWEEVEWKDVEESEDFGGTLTLMLSRVGDPQGAGGGAHEALQEGQACRERRLDGASGSSTSAAEGLVADGASDA